jgi:succinate dehydrogenase / fumarate reductase membrane anchor subunit
MATPLGKVRGLGAAHRGTETFWRQRLTALANIPLVVFLILTVVTHIGADYATMRAYFAQPIVALLLLALVISAAIHMRIGLKEIIEDYVHGAGAKVAALVLVTFFAVGVGLASALALIKIGLGSWPSCRKTQVPGRASTAAPIR